MNGAAISPLRMTPLVVLSCFLLLMVLGITLGEPSRVLEQARSICLACIGIG
ncbi:MAG: CD1871A family CXXC motif-containing protein [Desulfobulbus sp.]|nr:CD1871A family CXXC motif-containing protein [Desulfobulbus sp.]